MRGIAADVRLAHADIDDVGVGFGNSDGAHRSGLELAVGDRHPVHAAIDGFPDSAAGGAEVVDIGLRGDARDSHHAAAAEWADVAILEFLERIEVGLRRQNERGKTERDDSFHLKLFYGSAGKSVVTA